jgi:hypothetical protein
LASIKEMKNYNKIVYILILNLLSFSINAQNSSDHLEPVPGVFGEYDFAFEYYSNIRKVLLKDLSDTPDVRFLTLPSFSPEYVLDLNYDKKTEEYYLIFRVCESQIWTHENGKNIKVKEYKKKIDKNNYILIVDLFQTVVKETKYSKDAMIGIDGTDYYFMVFDNGIKAGKVWSPNENSKMGRLVEIGNDLIKFTRDKSKFNNSLKEKIELLYKDLK